MKKVPRLDADWHRAHPMPKNPTTAQRLEWHRAHQARCACRPIPESLRLLARPDWTCPRCRQRFVQRNARHSCLRQSPSAFFAGHPAPYALFKAVREQVSRLGPVEVVATRSQVSFRARTRFAWVWLPQRWLSGVPQDALVLTLDLDRRQRSRKIKQSVQVRPGRWTHHIVLRRAAELDADVRRWLRRAHALAAGPVE